MLLKFYRYTACPMCQFRGAQTKSRVERLKAQNVEVVHVFLFKSDRAEEAKDYIATLADPCFPILMAQDSTYAAYHTEKSCLCSGLGCGVVLQALRCMSSAVRHVWMRLHWWPLAQHLAGACTRAPPFLLVDTFQRDN